MKGVWLVWIWLLAALSACQAVSPTPVPTPEVIQVRLTPALGWLGPYFNACALQTGGSAVVIDLQPAGAPSRPGSIFSFQWGAPPGEELPGKYAFVGPVGADELVFVVHPSNPTGGINRADLQAIFTGATRTWPDNLGDIHLYRYPDGEDIQTIATSFIGQTPRPSERVQVVPDPEALRAAVAQDPAGLGILPRRWLDDSVKALAVQGEGADILRQPVLVFAENEPQGKARRWLNCVQGMMK